MTDDALPDLLRSAQNRLSSDDADRHLVELARELGCDVGSVGVPNWPLLLERVRDLRAAATQPEPDPPDFTANEIEDVRTDLLRSLAALEIMREVAVVFREERRGRDRADELEAALETMRDPQRLAQLVTERIANPVRVKWLLHVLPELRPKREP